MPVHILYLLVYILDKWVQCNQLDSSVKEVVHGIILHRSNCYCADWNKPQATILCMYPVLGERDTLAVAGDRLF